MVFGRILKNDLPLVPLSYVPMFCFLSIEQGYQLEILCSYSWWHCLCVDGVYGCDDDRDKKGGGWWKDWWR